MLAQRARQRTLHHAARALSCGYASTATAAAASAAANSSGGSSSSNSSTRWQLLTGGVGAALAMAASWQLAAPPHLSIHNPVALCEQAQPDGTSSAAATDHTAAATASSATAAGSSTAANAADPRSAAAINNLPSLPPPHLRRPFVMAAEEKAGGLQGDVARLRRWLEAAGSDAGGIEIRASSEGSAAGLSLWASKSHRSGWLPAVWRWLSRSDGGDVTLAAFPVALVVSLATVLEDPIIGPDFSRLLQEGTIDERTAVMLLLLMERKRGERSPMAPWLNLLPRIFATPLQFEEQELQELRGTTLHTATRLKLRELEREWQRLAPIVSTLQRKAGEPQAACFHDFLWAYSIFWSRAQTLVDAHSGDTVETAEAIVPGLDFANHSDTPICRWALASDNKGERKVQLVAPRSRAPVAGQELTINYGDKSNEELLFHYGFAEEGNPNDMLMVACPLPPEPEWDELMHARVALLIQRGLRPQLFLPPLDDRQPPGSLPLTEEVTETLEALVMEPQQLAQELQAYEDAWQQQAAGQEPETEQPPPQVQKQQRSEVEQAGLRMAVLTSLARLLEAKAEEMEGPNSTGSLEQDLQLLQQGGLPSSVHVCVVYRARQKQLARQHLRNVNAQLQAEMGKRATL